MAILRFRMLVLTGSVLLAGCTSFRGPAPIYTNAGLPPERVSEKPSGFLYKMRDIFKVDLEVAYNDRISDRISQPNINKMLRGGFGLIHANCGAYFDEMGRNQKRSQVLRDLISPITTVLTGVLALQDFSKNPSRKEDILSIISLGSGALASGLDIYDTRFLFGTDNIDSVETMTLNAITAHRNDVLANPPSEFAFAMTQLIDNQDICTPPQILTLVRESIRNANPQPPAATDGDANDHRPVSVTSPQ